MKHFPVYRTAHSQRFFTHVLFLCLLCITGNYAGWAQALPAPWTSAAVGDAAPVSAHSDTHGTFTLVAAGRDIQDAADGFGFVAQPAAGDVTITAHVVSLTHTNEWAKAGVMLRAGTGADAINVFFAVTPTNGITFQHRDAVGAATTAVDQPAGAAPLWLRLVRSGSQVTAFTSPDGSAWTRVIGATSFLPRTVSVGLAATSHAPGTPGTAVFDQVTVVRAAAHAQGPAVTAQVICHGDSLTAGYNTSSGLLTATGTTYPGVLARTLGPTWRVANLGTGGWPLGALIGEAPQKVDPLFDPSLKENVLIVFGGTNDLGGGHRTAEAAFADLVTYCRARHAAHPWRILVVTPPVAAYPNVYPADFDAQMVRYDALIRRDWRWFADGLVDAAANPHLGQPGAEHDPAYFSPKDFTHLTDAGYAIVGRDAAVAVRALATGPSAPLHAPRLTFQNRAAQSTLGAAYQSALENLLRINTLADFTHAHDAGGLLTGDPPLFVRAGGGYNEPWTRDGALNSWNAASLLEPQAARNTLWAVCRRDPSGALTIQQDNQWWDKVIWITGAWNHYAVTGDRTFLLSAYGVAQEELARMKQEHYSAEYGLFQGPAFFADGIAGYPEPEYDPKNASSFVLDHHDTAQLMVLSTNCVYYNAYRCASRMATELKRPAAEARQYDEAAAALKASINARLWMPSRSTYGYFVHGAGPAAGTVDPSQEGIGLAFAVLFGVASPAQAQSIFRAAHRSPHGITESWPPFARFDAAHPGRHNAVVWPLVNGMFANAAAQAGRADLFQSEAEDAARLAAGSGHRFYEIYNAETGAPDGGWQSGWHWPSQPDQTWSATAYLRTIYVGLFGMKFAPEALSLAPTLPAAWGAVTLTEVHYRAAVLSVTLRGQGSHIMRVVYDGKLSPRPVVPASATGPHTLVVTLGSR